jgi:hypothetical protein
MTLKTSSSREDMHLPALTPQRNPDGTIDYAHYRRRTRQIRQAQLHRIYEWPILWIRPLIAFALITAAIVMMPTKGPQPTSQRGDIVVDDAHSSTAP